MSGGVTGGRMAWKCAIVMLLAALGAAAGDWPTHRGDMRRTGVSQAGLALPLNELWVHTACHEPRPAWPPPAREDVLHRVPRLSPSTAFDRAYAVAVSGGKLYYGSSADDSVYCLDAATGEVRWSFVTEGPVRLAPSVCEGRVFAGSDDGYAYCLDAESGALVWKRLAGPADQRICGNGRMISLWPVRSGVLVADGTAYFSGGLFPNEGVYVRAVRSMDGEEVWNQRIPSASQGYLLASTDRLFLPTGRTAPVVLNRLTGQVLGTYEGLGGCFAVVLDDMLAHGPGEKGELVINEPRASERIVAMPGIELMAQGGAAYALAEDGVHALDRARYLSLSRAIAAIERIASKDRTPAQKEELDRLREQRADCDLWRSEAKGLCTFIMAGDQIVAGGDEVVLALDRGSGSRLWSAPVPGRVYSLAIAEGCLYASTDRGRIHCFAPADAFSHQDAEQEAVGAPSGGDFVDDAACVEAEFVLRQGGVDQGYCLILGSNAVHLYGAIAKQSRLRVIGVVEDEVEAEAARKRLAGAGLYGVRVVIHTVNAGQLPYPDFFANLIVWHGGGGSEAVPHTPASEVLRVLRPCGGRFILGGAEPEAAGTWNSGVLPDWQVCEEGGAAWWTARRGPLAGGGEWTHTYADPANTACSGDSLVGSPLRLQWFGAPGPERMVDRHFRNVPPLYKAGRVFIPGDGVTFAVDAYNGSPLWSAEMPEALRVGTFLDTTNRIVDDEYLFVAAGRECRRFRVESGEEAEAFGLPGSGGEWGYLARVNEVLLGTGRPEGTTYQQVTYEAELDTEPLWYPNMRLATSRWLFALDAESGQVKWMYGDDEAAGLILDTTITVSGGRVCFVRGTGPAAEGAEAGRWTMRELVAHGELHLVAIDAATGQAAFDRAIHIGEIEQPCYMNAADGVLLVSGSRIVGGASVVASGRASLSQLNASQAIDYCFYAFDAGTGEPRWTASHRTDLEVRGGHGEYNRHPTLIGHTAYTWPYAYALSTGERVEGWKFDRLGHGCGGVSAAEYALFWRGSNPWMYDLRPDCGPFRITQVSRPGCWINIIPAGGLVLIPEASAGCTCPYPIQTSMAFAPRAPAS